MTEESQRRGRRKALKYAAAIASIALAGWLGYCYVATLNARRPRFDEAAWKDANAVLVEAVGKDAVQRGVLSIPRADIAVPPRSFAATGVSPSTVISCDYDHVFAESVMVFLDGPRSFLMRKARTCRVADPVAPLDEKEARHIIAVFYYLEKLQAPSVTGRVSYNEQCLFRRFSLNDAQFDYPNGPLTSDGKKLDVSLMAYQLKGHLALAYVESLFRSGQVRIADNAGEIRALGKALIEHALPPRNVRDALLVNYGIGFLTTYPDASALKLLGRVLRIAAKGRADTWWKQLPLIAQLYAGGEYTGYLGSVDMAIWAARNLGMRPESERAQTAFDAEDGVARNGNGGAVYYLATARPSEYAGFLAKSYPSYDAKTRVTSIRSYYRSWGSDIRVAQAGVNDADVQARFLANWQVFKATHDPKRLSACLACLSGLHNVTGIPGNVLLRDYGPPTQAYFDEPTLAEIPAAFLSVVNGIGDDMALAQWVAAMPGAAERAFAVLLLAGGKENVDAAMRIANAYETAGLVSPQGGYFAMGGLPYDYSAGFATMFAIGDAKDPQVADRVIEFVAARSPTLAGGFCEALVAGLAERGDTRLIPILNAALEGERQHPSGRRCVDREKGRPFDFGHFLGRALTTVEMRNAADPITYLGEAAAWDPDLLQETTARFLGERYTTPELQALLADDRTARFRSAICLALMAQREKQEYPRR